MMTAQVLSYDSPLYGRRTAQMRLKQIPFEHYHEFVPEFLLQKEVSEIGSYFSVLKAIAAGNHKLSAIASV